VTPRRACSLKAELATRKRVSGATGRRYLSDLCFMKSTGKKRNLGAEQAGENGISFAGEQHEPMSGIEGIIRCVKLVSTGRANWRRYQAMTGLSVENLELLWRRQRWRNGDSFCVGRKAGRRIFWRRHGTRAVT